MSNILFINPPIREWSAPNNPPLGLLYMAAYLKTFDHKADICDLNALREIRSSSNEVIDWKQWIKCFLPDNYDYIGLSGLISTSKVQLEILQFLKGELKKYKKKPQIVLGGGLATAATGFAIEQYSDYIDYVVIDEGETPVAQLLLGCEPEAIYNLRYKKGSKWIPSKQKTYIHNLDLLPFPDYSKVPVEAVYLGNPIWGRATGNSSSINFDMKRSLNMIISRGCPFSCNFCLHQFNTVSTKYKSRDKYRYRSVGNVIEEIKQLHERFKIDFIGFVDDNTCLRREWIVEFSAKMVSTELNEKVHWGGSARVDELDSEMLAIMRKAGCEFLGIGVESVVPEILKNMNKYYNPSYYIKRAKEAVHIVKEAGITCNCTFIAGYPGETWETLRTTAQFMVDNDVRNNMFFATPYPKTKLFEDVINRIIAKYGSVTKYIFDLGDATEFKINCTDDFSDEELIYARKCAIGGRPDLITRKEFLARNGEFNEVELDPLLNEQLLKGTRKGR